VIKPGVRRGILSPLIFNIVRGALGEHLTGSWKSGGQMPAPSRRAARRRQGLPSWWVVRYAGDFAVLTGGTAQDLAALREQIARVPATPGLRFSGARTRMAPMSEGPSFPGVRHRAAPQAGNG
jgi:RNA-directed DNA polymerase